jgi:hypothetical protein
LAHSSRVSGWPASAQTAAAAATGLVSHSRTVPSSPPAATTRPGQRGRLGHLPDGQVGAMAE